MDCHNRPAHKLQSPESAVNLAMSLTNIEPHIDPSLPYIKTNAVGVLCRAYTNQTEALQTIATTLAEKFPNDPRIHGTIAAVQQIYTNNFFPEMKASWRDYPDNIGHKDFPGCFQHRPGHDQSQRLQRLPSHFGPGQRRAVESDQCSRPEVRPSARRI
jgi:hypothetical protein